MKGWKKIFHSNSHQRKRTIATLISDKKDLKSKIVTRDKEENCILIKGSIRKEDIKIINKYTSNNRAHRYMKQELAELNGGYRQFGNYSL